MQPTPPAIRRQSQASKSDHAAGGNRAEQPAEHAAQHAADDKHADDDERIERIDVVETARRPASAAAPAPAASRRRSRAIIRSTPAEMPPAKSPVLNFGVMILVDDALGGDVGERAFEAVADLDAQAGGRSWRRRAARRRRSSCGRSSRPPRPGSSTARWPPASVVGTISTAIWLPLRVSRSFSFCVSEAMSPPLSVPV